MKPFTVKRVIKGRAHNLQILAPNGAAAGKAADNAKHQHENPGDKMRYWTPAKGVTATTRRYHG